MIIILTGPTASGKTSTCWALMHRLERLVFLESDFLGFRKPFDWRDPRDLSVMYEQLIHNLSFQYDRGERDFVLTITPDMAVLFPNKRHMFERFGLPLYLFRFVCSPEELERRIPQRDRGEVQIRREMQYHRESTELLDRVFPDDTVFRRIDTTSIEEDAVAEKMCKMIQEQNQRFEAIGGPRPPQPQP